MSNAALIAKENYIYLHARFHVRMPNSVPTDTWEIQVFKDPITNVKWVLLSVLAQNGEIIEFKEKITEFPSEATIAAVHLLLC